MLKKMVELDEEKGKEGKREEKEVGFVEAKKGLLS